MGFGAGRVVIATGSRWRRDGVGRTNRRPIPGVERPGVITPDEVMAGDLPAGPVVIFDDDHYYMGGVLAETLRAAGREVTLVTPAALVSIWTENTLEQWRIQARLLELGVGIVTGHNLVGMDTASVEIACVFSERRRTLPAAAVVLVTSRVPDDALYHALASDPAALERAGIRDVARIGDCLSPGTIAAAVHSGHRFARDLSLALTDEVPFALESIEPAILARRSGKAAR
jgi:dimethylamine/trimethylamine dehydrogenase